MREPAPESPLELRLYVAGQSVKAQRAISNLARMGSEELGRVPVEVVDVLQDPQAAEEARILATPTLVRLSPLPVRRVVGDLSDPVLVLLGLELDELPRLVITDGEPA